MGARFKLLYNKRPRGQHMWANADFTKFSYPCVMDDFGNSVPLAGPFARRSHFYTAPFFIYWRDYV